MPIPGSTNNISSAMIWELLLFQTIGFIISYLDTIPSTTLAEWEFSGLNRLPWSGTGDNTDSRHLEPFWSPIRPTESIKLNDMKAKYDAGFMISTCWPVSCLFPIAKDVASRTTIEINGFCSTDARLGLPKRMPVFPWMTASRFGSPCLCDAARRDSGWGGGGRG